MRGAAAGGTARGSVRWQRLPSAHPRCLQRPRIVAVCGHPDGARAVMRQSDRANPCPQRTLSRPPCMASTRQPRSRKSRSASMPATAPPTAFSTAGQGRACARRGAGQGRAELVELLLCNCTSPLFATPSAARSCRCAVEWRRCNATLALLQTVAGDLLHGVCQAVEGLCGKRREPQEGHQ